MFSINCKNSYNGFTLIEVAIVLLIVGFLLGAIITPMGAQRETLRIKQAREELKMIEEALYGFVIAKQRLPCPAQPGSGSANPDAAGPCAPVNARGFVPSTTLGLTGRFNCDNLLLDPWGNPYRYSVTRSNGRAFTTDIPAVGVAALTPNLRICGDAACGVVLTTEAVAVIYSMGSGWNTLGGADETENAETTIASGCGLSNYRKSSDNRYVHRDRVEAGANQFNDIVRWISPNILYAKLLAAGVL